ncbi:PTS sugar transporter subunit IIA [Oscillospiraceae bacterium MB08-C2-2]|nr:PTS sugar transporter subunit IIA [Oscillospiraceae bacterium MB08-C2-2]
MSVSEVINQNAVVTDLDAANKAEVLDALAQLLFEDGSVTDKQAFIDDVYLRESEGKTGIGNGVAIPHGKSEVVAKTCIAVAKLKNPIEWETIDGKPVQVIILFAVDGNDKNNYFVKLMSQVARMLARDGFCSSLMSAKDKDELLELFQNI